MKPRLERVLHDAVEVFEQVRVPYAVVGGLAIGAWGVARATRDVDVYAELEDSRRSEIELELRKRGFDVPAMEAELQRFGVFRSRSKQGVFLDVFNAVGPLGEAIIAHRREVEVGGRGIWFIRPEELAVLKAFSDRARDFEDLAKLLSLLGDELDIDYIEGWAVRLDESIGTDEVSQRIRRARGR